MKQWRVKPSICVECGKTLDGLTQVRSVEKPKADGVTMCWYCGTTMMLTPDGDLRRPTNEELVELQQDFGYLRAKATLQAHLVGRN